MHLFIYKSNDLQISRPRDAKRRKGLDKGGKTYSKRKNKKRKKKTGTQRGKNGNIWSRRWGAVSQITSSESPSTSTNKIYMYSSTRQQEEKQKKERERKEGAVTKQEE